MEAGGIEPPTQPCKGRVFPLAPRPRNAVKKGSHRLEVDLDGVLDVGGVAAGERDADRGADRVGGREDELVARPEALLGQGEPAEAVVLPRVGAREEDDEVR